MYLRNNMAMIMSGRVLTPSYRQATRRLPWCGCMMQAVGRIRALEHQQGC